MISRELLKANLKYLNGYLPVYKPSGLCSHRLSEAIRLDLFFVFEHVGLNYGQIYLNHARDLEPFADGLMTFIYGFGRHKRRNFALADYTYKADVRFGIQRQFNCIDGAIIAESSTRDITPARIIETLKEFEGEVSQYRCKSYRVSPPYNNDLRNPNAEREYNHVDIYNQMILGHSSKTKQPQKYPHNLPPRLYLVRSIKLDSYVEPHASFSISCRGGFSVRKFASDLAERLGTHASVIKMTRLQEGPMCLGDLNVLQPYELNLEYYILRMKNLSKLYSEFNEEVEPLWENMST